MTTYAIDFEVYYDDEVTVKKLGPYNYARHPEAEAYLVAVSGTDGFRWAGHPNDVDWQWLAIGSRWVSHNAAFDSAVYFALPTGCDGWWPRWGWHCTANLSAYLLCGRSLADASKHLLGREVNKGVRDALKGKRFDDLPDDGDARAVMALTDIPQPWQKTGWKKFTPKRRAAIPTKEEVVAYCQADADACLELWARHSARMPEDEHRASQHTLLMTARGIGLDENRVSRGLSFAKSHADRAARELPWFGEVTEKGKPVALTSIPRVREECRRQGIPEPETTSKSDAAFKDWAAEFGERAPFVEAVNRYRSAAAIVARLEAMRARSSKGRLYYDLKFFGAHTGRWQGDTGLNMLNFPRTDTIDKHGFPPEMDPRKCLVPAPGHKLVVADLSQIEARITLWLAGDWKQLKLVEDGMELYEAHARATMGYKDPRPLAEADPLLRNYAKIRVLQLGFGCGWKKYRVTGKLHGLDISEEQAKWDVRAYRESNGGIVNCWDKCEDGLRWALSDPAHTLDVALPSGRVLSYLGVHRRQTDDGMRTFGRLDRAKPSTNLYGPKVFENVVQSVCRDLLVPVVLDVEHLLGFPVVLHVYDELVAEVPEDRAEEAVAAIRNRLTQVPAWAEGLPVAGKVSVSDRYDK